MIDFIHINDHLIYMNDQFLLQYIWIDLTVSRLISIISNGIWIVDWIDPYKWASRQCFWLWGLIWTIIQFEVVLCFRIHIAKREAILIRNCGWNEWVSGYLKIGYNYSKEGRTRVRQLLIFHTRKANCSWLLRRPYMFIS